MACQWQSIAASLDHVGSAVLNIVGTCPAQRLAYALDVAEQATISRPQATTATPHAIVMLDVVPAKGAARPVRYRGHQGRVAEHVAAKDVDALVTLANIIGRHRRAIVIVADWPDIAMAFGRHRDQALLRALGHVVGLAQEHEALLMFCDGLMTGVAVASRVAWTTPQAFGPCLYAPKNVFGRRLDKSGQTARWVSTDGP